MALEGIAPGEPAGRLLKELGCDTMIKLVRGDRGLYFPDFSISRPPKYQGARWRRERLKELFPHEAANIDRFYRLLETTTDLITLGASLRGIALPPVSSDEGRHACPCSHGEEVLQLELAATDGFFLHR
jgi:hypothetical protein